MADTTAPIEGTIEWALLRRVERVVGYLPVGTCDLLRILAHPDVLPLTRDYLSELDSTALLDIWPTDD
jgi:hypothetical protein